MIFTIGYTEAYEEGFSRASDDNPLLKKGRCDGYNGGSVWETYDEVKRYLKDNSDRLIGYSVYGVLADWETETEERNDRPFRDLLVDAELMRLDEHGKAIR